MYTDLTRLTEGFEGAKARRHVSACETAARMFQTIFLPAMQLKLGDNVLEFHIIYNSEAGRFGVEDPENNSALYVEIGPSCGGPRQVSLVYQKDGAELVRASTERSSIYGDVTDLVFEKGKPEDVIDLLHEVSVIFSHLEDRLPELAVIHRMECF